MVERFGSLSHIFARISEATSEDNDLPPHIGTRLKHVMDSVLDSLDHKICPGVIISKPGDLIRYLQRDMAGLTREIFRVLYLDSENRLITDRTMWEGTVDHVQVHPREIAKVALLENATAVILAHNHPYGSGAPSEADIELTCKVASAVGSLNIALHDHIIVGQSGGRSMRRLMPDIFETTTSQKGDP